MEEKQSQRSQMYLKASVPWIKIEFFLIPYNKDTHDHMPSRPEMDEVVKQAKRAIESRTLE